MQHGIMLTMDDEQKNDNQTEAKATHKAPTAGDRFLRVLYIVVAAALCTLVAAGFFSQVWFGEIACSFRPYYCIGLSLCVLSFLEQRMRRAAGIVLVFLIANTITIAPLLIKPATNASSSESNSEGHATIRFMEVNVENNSSAQTQLLKYIDKMQPDVIAVTELTPEWDKGLRAALPAYKHVWCAPAPGYYGIGIYSKLPLTDRNMFVPGVEQAKEPCLSAIVSKDKMMVRVVAMHVFAPHTPNEMAQRNTQFSQIANHIQTELRPDAPPSKMEATPRAPITPADNYAGTVVLGDLNTTPWSQTYASFLASLDLHDSQMGYGLNPTCDIYGFLTAPVDYCLIPRRATATSYKVGPDIGSDHKPVVVDVAISR